MISVDTVKKSYGGKGNRTQVLRGISLQIQDGDFLVLLGASGSGKSTFLNVISGLERPDSGQVWYHDVDITKLSDPQLTQFRKETAGFVFQQYYLLPAMTVEKNVRMGADLAGNRAYRQLLKEAGLEDKLHKYPGELSGGEQQRAAIARALAKKPKVLFLDEPTGALDEATGRQILALIDRLHRELGFTVVMVTHNRNIADMANTVVKMNSGLMEEVSTNLTRKSAYEIGW